MNAVVPLIISCEGIYLSPVFVQLFFVPLFVVSSIFILLSFIKFIIYLIRSFK